MGICFFLIYLFPVSCYSGHKLERTRHWEDLNKQFVCCPPWTKNNSVCFSAQLLASGPPREWSYHTTLRASGPMHHFSNRRCKEWEFLQPLDRSRPASSSASWSPAHTTKSLITESKSLTQAAACSLSNGNPSPMPSPTPLLPNTSSWLVSLAPIISSHTTLFVETVFGECGYVQLINEFVDKEGISVDGDWQVEVLLGRDMRPSGDALLQAAKPAWARF